MDLKITTLEKAEYLVDLYRQINRNPSPDKNGGFLNLVHPYFSSKYCCPIGDIPGRKAKKYYGFSLEKATRLYSDWLRNFALGIDTKDILSSYQTRDPKENKWGGAVLFEDKHESPSIISFSGLNEFGDEAFSLILGYSFGLAKDKTLFERVKNASNNPIVDEMFEKFKEKYPL